MKRFALFIVYATCLVAVSATIGCGDGATFSHLDPMSSDRADSQNAMPMTGRMVPGTSGQDLLYISVGQAGYGLVSVFSYPQGKRVGTLTGFNELTGECADTSGNVFIVGYANDSFSSSLIYEYAHGGASPIAVFTDPGGAGGCSVDPTTGDLAVGSGSSPYGGAVALYQPSQTKAAMYYSSQVYSFENCGYDDNGNLYLQGWLQNGQVKLARLASGSKTIEVLNLSTQIYTAGDFAPSVQWDGANMTISSFRQFGGNRVLLVYRLRISGKNATVIGTTQLKSHKHIGHTGQSWIFGNAIIGAQAGPNYGKASFWRYPKGGRSTFTIEKVSNLAHQGAPWGVTISPAQTSKLHR